jgi:hypothetical protein
VYVGGRFSLTMRRELRLPRNECIEPVPTVRWNADGSVGLVDPAGVALEAQPRRPFLFRAGGC